MTSQRPQGWRKGQYLQGLIVYLLRAKREHPVRKMSDSEFDRLEAEYLLTLKEEIK